MAETNEVQAALEHAAHIAEREGRNTKYGPCDTYHNGERAGHDIAAAIRAYAKRRIQKDRAP